MYMYISLYVCIHTGFCRIFATPLRRRKAKNCCDFLMWKSKFAPLRLWLCNVTHSLSNYVTM